MKTFTASRLALVASLSLVAALPSSGLQKSRRTACPEGVEVTLIGAEPSNPADQYSVVSSLFVRLPLHSSTVS